MLAYAKVSQNLKLSNLTLEVIIYEFIQISATFHESIGYIVYAPPTRLKLYIVQAKYRYHIYMRHSEQRCMGRATAILMHMSDLLYFG